MINVNKIKFILILASLLSFFSSIRVFANDHTISKKLATDFAELCATKEFSGVVLIAVEDKILFEKACGTANRSFLVPNTIATKFNLGSVGKLFTSVAVAQLIQQNKLSLYDPINKYLSDWLPSDNSDNSDKMTIQQLLVHASGLGNFMDDGRWKLGSDSGLYVKVNDYRALIQDDKVQFIPGQSQVYSNNGYIILGAIIEKVAGMDYVDYLTKNIFVPAGMKNTGIFRLDDLVENRAEGYFYECKQTKCKWKNNNFETPFVGSPAGGAYSTVEDLFQFAKALHHAVLLDSAASQTILSPKIMDISKKLTLKNITVNGVEIAEQFSQFGFAGAWNQYGFAVWDNPKLVGHTGGTLGAAALFATTPDGKYTIIILSNVSNAAPINYYKKVRSALGWSDHIINY